MNEYYQELNINPKIIKKVLEEESKLKDEFLEIEENERINSAKVIKAFWNEKISESHFNGTSGYGYSDVGREAIERVFAQVLGGEASLVRSQFISGTHAISTCLFALLRPNDTMLSITGTPYETIQKVIGIKENASSLKSFNINYDQIDLINDDFDVEKIKKYLNSHKVKVIEIQRSKGYSTRKSIKISQIEKVIKEIRKIDKEVIIMVDNCYSEFVEVVSPLEVGANVIVGSLIKNLGAGIAPNGAYICGDKEIIELCSERLNVPGQGLEVGPSGNSNKLFLQGLYFAPSVVASSLKVAVLTSKVLASLGYEVEPKYNEKRADIVQNIVFGNKDDLINYTIGLQSGGAIDSHVCPTPYQMPGYTCDIIMASSSFVQGSSIELSGDAPIREPYILYQQGSLTYEYGKIGLMKALERIM